MTFSARLFQILLCTLIAGCATGTLTPTLSSAITPSVAALIEVGQTRAEVEKKIGHAPNPFTYALRPEVRFQAWPFVEGSDQKCLLVTYDLKEVVTEVAVLIKDRGPFAFPLPAGC
jgi:hypothetical protein